MNCTHCGAPLNPTDRFCTSCGSPVPQAAPNGNYNAPNGNYNAPNGNYNAPNGNYNAPNGNYNAPNAYQQYGAPINQPYNTAPKLGMTWCTVLSIFLFIGAVANLASAINTMTGNQYGAMKPYVYGFYGGLRPVDIIYGILLLGISVLQVVTAFAIIKRRRSAPALVTFVYAALAILTVLYCIVACSILGTTTSEIVTQCVASAIVGIVMIVINRIYFGKRKHLFVN